MAETGGNTSIKRVDVENLIKEGKIYATKADAEAGKTANVNSQYFDENNWEFDSDGRIIEIQKDGSKVVMGWANKDDLVSPKQTSSDRLSDYNSEGSYPATSDIGSQKTNSNTNRTQSATATGTDQRAGNNFTNSKYKETMTTAGVTAGAGSISRLDQAMTPINTNSNNVDKSKLAQDYYGTPGTTNPHKENTSTGPAMKPVDAMQVIGHGDYVSDKHHLPKPTYKTPTYDTPRKSNPGDAMQIINDPEYAMQVVGYGSTVGTNKSGYDNNVTKAQTYTDRNGKDAMTVISKPGDAMQIVNNTNSTSGNSAPETKKQ